MAGPGAPPLRSTQRRACAALVLCCAASACSGTRADTGLEAWMRVKGAQFFKDDMPAATNGPDVATAALATNTVAPGFLEQPLTGALAADATSAAIALGGDRGYWVLLAGPPSPAAPSFPSFDATLSFAPDVPPGAYALLVRAVDGAGRFGAPFPQTLTITATGIPDAALVMHLEWDTEADLDLHVVDPSGVEVFYRNITDYSPMGQPADVDADLGDYGSLDFDSNAGCVIDGRRQENVVFRDAYPPGHYIARVDTKSMCAADHASWMVEARRRGVAIASARGTSLPTDTRFNHDRGAGLTAVEFDVP